MPAADMKLCPPSGASYNPDTGQHCSTALAREKAWWIPAWLDRLLSDLDVEGDKLAQKIPLLVAPQPCDETQPRQSVGRPLPSPLLN